MKKYLQQLFPVIIGKYLNATAFIFPKYTGKKALAIFGTPRKGQIRVKDAAYLQTYTKQLLTYNNQTFATYYKGNGALKLMLVHGWESNSARWQHLINYIETIHNATYILIDAPAHGASEGTTFDSIQYANYINVAYQQYQPTVLIGHSIGAGSIAYCIHNVAKLPIQKLVLMASPNTFTEIINVYINIIKLNKRAQLALHQAIEQKYNLKSTEYNVSNYVKNINTATIIVHDEEDEISPLINAHQIANNMKHGTLHITKGYKHGLQNKTVFEIIGNFLK